MDLLEATRPAMAAFCFIALVYKLLTSSKAHRDPATMALLAVFASGAIAWTVTTPGISAALERRTGLPNLSTLVMELLAAVVLSPALLVAVITWSNSPADAKRKRRAVIARGSAIGAVMITLWIAAAVKTPDGTEYLVQNANRPMVIAYLLVFELGFGHGLTVLLRLCWPYARMSGDTWLRRGLFVTMIGAGADLLVIAGRLISVPALMLGYDPMAWEVALGVVSRLGTIGIVLGLLIPSLAAQCENVAAWWRDLRSYQALGSLWHDLSQAFPEVSLLTGKVPRRAYLRVEEMRYLLGRRVIEIRDSWRALRPYVPHNNTRADTDVTHLALAAACSLRAALAAKSAGWAANEESGASRLERLETTNLDDDIEWLVRVGRAYTATQPQEKQAVLLPATN
ncbi:MAB_1171c family putative transporter [Amycolatopsis solani]|uniref:MAB_1171c family putative transporter n=1 Tax=Amycolatopsis solani TaxID=3028615 RepID=UPI0025AF6537|nr:MAB_1171c family putative transporter [Amycolatopsis sp. MEP2-6]